MLIHSVIHLCISTSESCPITPAHTSVSQPGGSWIGTPNRTYAHEARDMSKTIPKHLPPQVVDDDVLSSWAAKPANGRTEATAEDAPNTLEFAMLKKRHTSPVEEAPAANILEFATLRKRHTSPRSSGAARASSLGSPGGTTLGSLGRTTPSRSPSASWASPLRSPQAASPRNNGGGGERRCRVQAAPAAAVRPAGPEPRTRCDLALAAVPLTASTMAAQVWQHRCGRNVYAISRCVIAAAHSLYNGSVGVAGAPVAVMAQSM